jgi:hypothetical protein
METRIINFGTLLSLLVPIFSCQPAYIKINEKLAGKWKFESFYFINDKGKSNMLAFGNYSIKFDKDRKGEIVTDSLRFDFEYDFWYEQFEDGFADCDLKVENNFALPIHVIGRVQVYSYKFLDKNTLLFYAENEFDYVSNHVIKNATYKFVRE